MFGRRKQKRRLIQLQFYPNIQCLHYFAVDMEEKGDVDYQLSGNQDRACKKKKKNLGKVSKKIKFNAFSLRNSPHPTLFHFLAFFRHSETSDTETDQERITTSLWKKNSP